MFCMSILYIYIIYRDIAIDIQASYPIGSQISQMPPGDALRRHRGAGPRRLVRRGGQRLRGPSDGDASAAATADWMLGGWKNMADLQWWYVMIIFTYITIWYVYIQIHGEYLYWFFVCRIVKNSDDCYIKDSPWAPKAENFTWDTMRHQLWHREDRVRAQPTWSKIVGVYQILYNFIIKRVFLLPLALVF